MIFIFRFGSLGDGDAFIHKLLEEKHIETKEQLYKISLRPTSFDAKEELRARPQDDQSPQPQQQQSGFFHIQNPHSERFLIKNAFFGIFLQSNVCKVVFRF